MRESPCSFVCIYIYVCVCVSVYIQQNSVTRTHTYIYIYVLQQAPEKWSEEDAHFADRERDGKHGQEGVNGAAGRHQPWIDLRKTRKHT